MLDDLDYTSTIYIGIHSVSTLSVVLGRRFKSNVSPTSRRWGAMDELVVGAIGQNTRPVFQLGARSG